MARPDESHYVIDMTMDYIRVTDANSVHEIPVMQVWLDPAFPEAHRDPDLREYIAKIGVPALVRWNNAEGQKALVIFPPNISTDGQWHEKESAMTAELPHTPEQIERVINPDRRRR
jgi:hypothetical protein